MGHTFSERYFQRNHSCWPIARLLAQAAGQRRPTSFLRGSRPRCTMIQKSGRCVRYS
jgi:hypothetical protein